jgi:hypothetical protein
MSKLLRLESSSGIFHSDVWLSMLAVKWASVWTVDGAATYKGLPSGL